MIRWLSGQLAERFLPEILQFGILSTKIYGQYQMYGTEGPPLEGWLLQDEKGGIGGAVSRFSGGRLTVCALAEEEAQTTELRAFVRTAGFVSCEGELGLIRRLAGEKARIRSAPIWTPVGGYISDGIFDSEKSNSDNSPFISPAPSLGEVYGLLCRAVPAFSQTADFGGWLTDMSHRRRHGLGECYVLTVEKDIVSTISILYQSPGRAILDLMATEPACQGRGYAKLLLAALTGRLLARGVVPYAPAAADEVTPFYRKCGYREAGRWGEWRG